MRLTSPEFKKNDVIPPKFTCDGEDVNPHLTIEDLPEGTQSLALVVDDPDAPAGTWVHWVVYDIPPLSRIDADSVPGTQGTNDFQKQDYGGPCPPSGTHHYCFTVYALNEKLGLREGLSKGDLEEAIQGHILDKAELVGLYTRG